MQNVDDGGGFTLVRFTSIWFQWGAFHWLAKSLVVSGERNGISTKMLKECAGTNTYERLLRRIRRKRMLPDATWSGSEKFRVVGWKLLKAAREGWLQKSGVGGGNLCHMLSAVSTKLPDISPSNNVCLHRITAIHGFCTPGTGVRFTVKAPFPKGIKQSMKEGNQRA